MRPEVELRERQFARLLAAAEVYPTPYTRATVRARGCVRGALRHPGAVPGVPGAEGRLVELSSTQLRGQAATADRWLFSSGPVVRELRAWLRLTPRHPRYDQDGLTDRCLGLSRLEAVGLRAVLALRLNRPLAPLLAASGGAVLEPEHPVLVFTGRRPGPRR
ncbi:hypothetical protein ACFQZC_11455 [Streptacidiphilus monticola]